MNRLKDLLKNVNWQDAGNMRIRLLDIGGTEILTAPANALVIKEYEDFELISWWTEHDIFNKACQVNIRIRLAVGE